MPRGPGDWFRTLLLLAGILSGTWLRLRGLGELPLFGDEYHTLLSADWSYGAILTSFDAVGSHVPLPLLQRLSLDLLGPGVFVFRLVALVPALLMLLLAWPLLRAFVGRDAALLATLALALNPMHVYYSRFARSYALAELLGLMGGWALLVFLRVPSTRKRTGALLVGAVALLPWVHLSSLGFVLALWLAGVALALRSSRALALRTAGLFALGAVLALALFLPVLEQVLEYFRVMEEEERPLGWFGIPTLLAGGRVPAAAWCLALPLAAWLLWRPRERSGEEPGRGRDALVLSLASLLGPLALLLATNPRGMDNAWARYLLSAQPFLLALVALAWTGGAAPLLHLSPRIALGAGAFLVVAQHVSGPLGPVHAEHGAFSNTYLAMHPLPAFDEPFPGAPAFYRQLAAESGLRIVETPPIYTRAVLLYRNHARIHGQDVLVGWSGEMPRGIRRGPYARILELAPTEADYLVLHRDQKAEVRDYFEFVYDEVWPRVRRSADETFMRRQEAIYAQNLVGPEVTDAIAGRLRERYGPAVYKDERILVWKLRP